MSQREEEEEEWNILLRRDRWLIIQYKSARLEQCIRLISSGEKRVCQKLYLWSRDWMKKHYPNIQYSKYPNP